MGLRLPELWTVLISLSAVVNAASNQDCPAPDIANGFFISERETFAHDTELYYGCDDDFKPVEGTWWATVICQNGNWSSMPHCIKDTACIDPEIPNANYTAFLYLEDGEGIWIRCKSGYQARRNQGRAICVKGQWEGLPVCEKLNNSWCEPPPQIPKAVVINQVYKDLFPEGGVEYMCRSGFEMESNSNTTYCNYGSWIGLPSCREKQGHVPPPTTASPVTSGPVDNVQPMFTTIDKCRSLPLVPEGVPYSAENNMYVSYKCSEYYKLNGNRIVRCQNGRWTEPPTCEVNHCKLDTSEDSELKNVGVAHIKSGFVMNLKCEGSRRTKHAKCIDNQLHLSECCYWITHEFDKCKYFPINPSQ